MHAAVGVEDADAVRVLIEADDPGRGQQLDAWLRAHAFEQREMDVGAMDYRVGIGEALAEGGAGRDLADQRLVDRVHHHHPVGVDRAAARPLADAERVEGGEGVGRELHAGADLADLGRLLEHLDAKAALRQSERRGQPADAAARDDDGLTRARHDPGRACCRRSRSKTLFAPEAEHLLHRAVRETEDDRLFGGERSTRAATTA